MNYKIIYYPKFYCELNHIKYFWYNRKSWSWKHYKYSFDKLKKYVLKTINQVKHFKILRHYHNCLKKMDLYKKKVQYRIGKETKLISYKKTWAIGNNR